MNSTTTWLEVAINGPWSRVRQPNIPVNADEIVEAALACAAEGASIIHFHAYDQVTGRQRDDYDIYAPIIERIRSKLMSFATVHCLLSAASMPSNH